MPRIQTVAMAQVVDDVSASRSALPDWLIMAIVAAAIVLAVLSVILMIRGRTFVAMTDDERDQTRYPQLTREPVLIISALIIIVLAVLVLRAEG